MQYHAAIQQLCHDTKPEPEKHNNATTKRHRSKQSTITLPPSDPPSSEALNVPEEMLPSAAEFHQPQEIYKAIKTTEHCGVHHLVHGWTPTGHAHEVLHFCFPLNVIQLKPLKGQLYLSGSFRKTSTALTAFPPFYKTTARISFVLGCMLHSVWPDHYVRYNQAFSAGRWFSEDPGPFLGRAIVYKLQVDLHHDRHDAGPTACFPVGTWDKSKGGGSLIVPQLGAKFQ